MGFLYLFGQNVTSCCCYWTCKCWWDDTDDWLSIEKKQQGATNKCLVGIIWNMQGNIWLKYLCYLVCISSWLISCHSKLKRSVKHHMNSVLNPLPPSLWKWQDRLWWTGGGRRASGCGQALWQRRRWAHSGGSGEAGTEETGGGRGVPGAGGARPATKRPVAGIHPGHDALSGHSGALRVHQQLHWRREGERWVFISPCFIVFDASFLGGTIVFGISLL